MSADDAQRMMSVAQAAKRLGMGRNKLTALIDAGIFPAAPCLEGGNRGVTMAMIDAYNDELGRIAARKGAA